MVIFRKGREISMYFKMTPTAAVSPVQILVVVAITQVKAKENPSGEGFREQVNLPRLSRLLSAKAKPFIFWKEKPVWGIFMLLSPINYYCATAKRVDVLLPWWISSRWKLGSPKKEKFCWWTQNIFKMRLPSDGSCTLAKKSFLLFLLCRLQPKHHHCFLLDVAGDAKVGSTWQAWENKHDAKAREDWSTYSESRLVSPVNESLEKSCWRRFFSCFVFVHCNLFL